MKFTVVNLETGKKRKFTYTCVGWTNTLNNVLSMFKNEFPNVTHTSEVEARVYLSDFEYPTKGTLESIFSGGYATTMGLPSAKALLDSYDDIKDWHKNLLSRSLFRKHLKEDEDGQYFVIQTSEFKKAGGNKGYVLNCVLAALIRNPIDYPGGVISFYYKTLRSKKSATMLLVACSFHHGFQQSHSTFLPRNRWKGAFSKDGKGMDVIKKLLSMDYEDNVQYPENFFSNELGNAMSTPPSAGDLEGIISYLKEDKK